MATATVNDRDKILPPDYKYRYKFRLLVGEHLEADYTQPPADPVSGHRHLKKYSWKPDMYWGNVIETDTDLAAKFNQADPATHKFQRILSGTDAVPFNQPARHVDPYQRQPNESASDFHARIREIVTRAQAALDASSGGPEGTYDHMSENELRAMAKDEQINVKACRSKAELISVIKAAAARQPAGSA